MLFLTTPTVLFQLLQDTDLFGGIFETKKQVDKKNLGFLIQQFLPPLVILLINRLILLIIYYTGQLKS